jgi:hypothetical protein
MSSSILKTAALCLSLASAGCLQTTEPIHAPAASSHQSPLDSVGMACKRDGIRNSQAS